MFFCNPGLPQVDSCSASQASSRVLLCRIHKYPSFDPALNRLKQGRTLTFLSLKVCFSIILPYTSKSEVVTIPFGFSVRNFVYLSGLLTRYMWQCNSHTPVFLCGSDCFLSRNQIRLGRTEMCLSPTSGSRVRNDGSWRNAVFRTEFKETSLQWSAVWSKGCVIWRQC